MKLALHCCQGDRPEFKSPKPHIKKSLTRQHKRIILELGLGVSWVETGLFLGLASQSTFSNWQVPYLRKTRKKALGMMPEFDLWPLHICVHTYMNTSPAAPKMTIPVTTISKYRWLSALNERLWYAPLLHVPPGKTQGHGKRQPLSTELSSIRLAFGWDHNCVPLSGPPSAGCGFLRWGGLADGPPLLGHEDPDQGADKPQGSLTSPFPPPLSPLLTSPSSNGNIFTGRLGPRASNGTLAASPAPL